MSQSINTNIASLTAQRYGNRVQQELSTSMARLSSGLRINSAKDDAAGVAIVERFTTQIRGLNQAARNANDGISLAQTAESVLGTLTSSLQRIRELAVQSANATNNSTDRKALQQEVAQLSNELDRVASTSMFNNVKLFDGSFGTQAFQVGANGNQTVIASLSNARTNAYGNYNSGTAGYGIAAGTTAFGSNGVAASTTTVAGSLGSKTISVTANETAQSVASKINAAAGETGVTATARTQVKLTFATAGGYTLNLRSNNGTDQTISFALSSKDTADGLNSALAAINEHSGKTGVVAQLNAAGTDIILTNDTGNDIRVADTTTQNAGNVTVQKLDAAGSNLGGGQTLTSDGTADSTLSSGFISLDSDKSFSVSDSVTGSYFGTAATAATLQSVNQVDVATFDAATKTLKIVDAALSLINSERAKLGALQSRFEFAVSNAQTAAENLQASRSRIQDADFAAETAALSRAQVLRQAANAMVAQANQAPRQVLDLLRN